MSNLLDHARHELEIAGWFDEDSDYGGMLAESVMKMLELFSEEGHSGMSASMTINLFEKLARYEPLTPLTGEDDEWNKLDYGCDPVWQNKRCSRVFKNADGKAYDVEGLIFRRIDGSCSFGCDSAVSIEFPYVPKHELVDLLTDE